jgi:cystathionine beta-lyase family protein involved in aluminum resistance
VNDLQPGRLAVMTLSQASDAQYRLVDAICAEFSGSDYLDGGGLGLTDRSSPAFTRRVESVIAAFFGADDAILLHGSGTAAVREALAVTLPPGGTLLLHQPGPFRTTAPTLAMMGASEMRIDLHDLGAVRGAAPKARALLIQHTRQLTTDRYDPAAVIEAAREGNPAIAVVVDDNYAAMKVPAIGVQLGAELSAFSCFKLLGPEGIGCLLGSQERVARVRQRNASGGGAVQGWTARQVLEGLVSAPVSLAMADEVASEVAARLSGVAGIRRAWVANLEETVVLAKLETPVAARVIEVAGQHGAATRPVGTESRHELIPLVHEVSTFLAEADPDSARSIIRISPMRAGPATVERIIASALREATR